MQISDKTRRLCEQAELELAGIFSGIDRISGLNTEHVLDCFREHCVSESMFAPSTGYGYGDRGRDEAGAIIAGIFRTEAGFVRPSILSGTHALTVALFGILRPGDDLPDSVFFNVNTPEDFERICADGTLSLRKKL